MFVEDGAEGTDGIWARRLEAGRGGVDGDAVHMGKLCQGGEEFRELVGMFGCVIDTSKQDVLKGDLSPSGGDVVFAGGEQFL